MTDTSKDPDDRTVFEFVEDGIRVRAHLEHPKDKEARKKYEVELRMAAARSIISAAATRLGEI